VTTRGQQTQSVLATIDAALRDGTVSGDAMRWTPESPSPTQAPPPPSPRRPHAFGNLTGQVIYGSGSASAEYFVRLLAAPYAEHPDYRSEWRPGG